MKWDTYERKFRHLASANNKSETYSDSCLAYAKPLFERNLPVIFSALHLAKLIGTEVSHLSKMAYGTKHFYRCFTIPKSNGRLRTIREPLPDLKYVQKWILQNVLEHMEISDFAKAFIKGQSIKQNARFHKGQKTLITLDLKDFFSSISTYNVYSIFRKSGYTAKVSWYIAHLCTFDGTLPQGSPTSPYLSNLHMFNIDLKIANYCLSKGYRYTRYADDMAFSGDIDIPKLISFITKVVQENGLRINESKTRVAHQNARQEVTGIVVNSHLQAPRNVRRDIRQAVYYIQKFGLESHIDSLRETRKNYLRHLLGMVCYCLYVNRNDEDMKQYKNYLITLLNTMPNEL